MTEEEKEDFERVLKTGLKIIWGQHFTRFEEVLSEAKIRTMRQVRSRIVKKFVRKTIKHDKFKKWFVEDKTPRANTRAGNRIKFKPVPA